MNKAFLFDMDGVLIDSETEWQRREKSFNTKLYGEKITKQMGILAGMSMEMIYDRAVGFGFVMDKKKFYEIYNEQAADLYLTSPLTKDIEQLGQVLIERKFKLGIVSASPLSWINIVLSRLSFGKQFSTIISVNDHDELMPKPHPGGYLYAMQQLDAKPQTTFILEDSNHGIESGKAAGATVIGLQANLLPKYQQKGADYYAKTIEDVIELVNKLDRGES